MEPRGPITEPYQAALLAICGFEWSDTFGVYIDADGHRWDEPEDALNETLAQAEASRIGGAE